MFYKPSVDSRKGQKDRFNRFVRYGVDTSSPIARYGLHSNDPGAKLFDLLLSDNELREEIISVFKRIDLGVNSKIENWISRKEWYARRKISIKNIVEPQILVCEEGVTTRMYVMITILLIYLLENHTKYDFIGDLGDYREDDGILFWHELNDDIVRALGYESGKRPRHTIKEISKIKFNRLARVNFERLEDWFIDISEVEYLIFKCPQEKIWINNSNPESLENPMNLGLITCTHQPPWGRHPKYGPIPFSHFLNVEPFLRDYSSGLDSGLPNIDDYYEGLNRL